MPPSQCHFAAAGQVPGHLDIRVPLNYAPSVPHGGASRAAGAMSDQRWGTSGLVPSSQHHLLDHFTSGTIESQRSNIIGLSRGVSGQPGM